MNTILHLKKITVAAMAAILGALGANATPVAIPNASFETPNSPTQTSTNPYVVTDWVFNVQGGSYYGTEAIAGHFSSAGASTGNNAASLTTMIPTSRIRSPRLRPWEKSHP